MSNISYTLSARGKPVDTPVMAFLGAHFSQIPLEQIDSLFGFVEQSSLYGGRPFTGAELTDADVTALYDHDIGLRLPLSNHYVERTEYQDARSFLEKYHRAGNTVIVTNDDLARWIRADFPRYHIEASVIKNIDNTQKLERAFALYDTVVPPARLGDNDDFLHGIAAKDRIRLFVNAGCAYNCPSKICYPAVSRMNKYQGAPYRCSQPLIARDVSMHSLDVPRLVAMGFSRFKLLRQRTVTAF